MSMPTWSASDGALCAIYRLTEARASLSDVLASEVVELGGSLAGIRDWTTDEERFMPSVPVPGGEAANKPDAGANSLKLMINCVINRPDMGAARRADTAATVLRRWSVTPQTVPGVYDRGRIGLWFWPDEAYTHHPTRSAGYKLSSVTMSGVPNTPSLTLMSVRLDYSGKFSEHDGLGAQA